MNAELALLIFSWIWRIGLICCALVFAGMALISIRDIFRGRQSQNWMKTEGTILNAFIKEHPAQKQGRAPLLEPYVRYEYWIDGVRYENDRRTFDAIQIFKQQDIVERLLDPFKVNQKTTIYYNPTNHSQSTLNQSSRGNLVQFFSMVVICLMLLYGAFIF